jgi:hypothetical protein
VLTEEKLDDIWARLEHTPRKSLKRLAQETGVSKSNARMATQLLKPSSGRWCLVCCQCKKDCCVFSERNNRERYLHAVGQCFQHLLWSVNKGKNFPSIQKLSAHKGIGNTNWVFWHFCGKWPNCTHSRWHERNGASGGKKNSRGNLSTWRKSSPVPLCPSEIPYELGLNPGRHGERLATKYLSYCIAFETLTSTLQLL